jgi:hypothetical protein
MRRDLIDAHDGTSGPHGPARDSEAMAKADSRAAKPSKMRSLTNSLFAAFKSKAELRDASNHDVHGDLVPNPET